MIKVVLMLCSLVPLGMSMPYLLQAWSSSRLDKLDWIFYLLTIPAAVWVLRGEKTGKADWYALFLLLPMLLLALATPYHQINAVGVGASVGVIYAVLWLVNSWNLAYRVLPAAVILLLGTPSSSYHISLLLMCPVWMAWAVKFVLAILCGVWIWCNKRYHWQVKKVHSAFRQRRQAVVSC